jgi:phosphotransferase system enzyme I (PtsP)
MEDAYLRERASDIRDLGRRILTYLQQKEPVKKEIPDNAIIVGEELTPALLAEVPEGKLAAIVSVMGSSNSHIAILARAMGIPTVMGLVDMPFQNLEGQELVVDGYRGHVYCNLSGERKAHFEEIIQEEQEMVRGLESVKELPCETRDGQSIKLLVNTGLMTDVVRSLDRGAEGVGLYRTEVPFMMHERFPSEYEQSQIYRQQMEAFAPRQVVMRTLDIGGDKALDYFPIQEENPFLGWRGIRVTLDHPEIFLVQVRAMLRASEGLNNLGIMLPMVSNVSELEEAQRLIHRAQFELIEEGCKIEAPSVGMMVEVPANLYQIKEFASRVDFLSVGSNDLTQYLLAVDRANPRVADLYNNFHPAVLHALKKIIDDASEHNTPVSICGEIAGDPMGAVLLAAMGYQNLSMNSSSLLKVKAVLREVEMSWARELLQRVLSMDSPLVIKSTLEFSLRRAGIPLSRLGINKSYHINES